MKYYRIHTTHKTTGVIIKSPFVFKLRDVQTRCERLNYYFKNGNHIYQLSKKYTKAEIRSRYSKDSSPQELLTITKHLEFNKEIENDTTTEAS